MPNSPTANMLLVLPTEDGDADTWDTYINMAFGLVDQHDHTTGKGARIPSAALKIDQDVMWASSGTNYSITDLRALDFTPQAPANVNGYASALFVSDVDANLYFRNSLGTNVQITSGSTINVSIVGGIGGDYASVGALVDYDDANDTYRLRQETNASVRQYAKVATADLILREYRAAGNPTVPVNAVTVKSPTALASAYSITLPSALPATTSLLRMSSAGVLDLTSAIDQDITLASNRGITLQGTGYVKRGSQTEWIAFTPGGDWLVQSGSPPAWTTPGAPTPIRVEIAASADVLYPIVMGHNKQRVIGVSVIARSLTSASTFSLVRTTGIGTGVDSNSVVTLAGSVTSISVPADGVQNARTLTLLTPYQQGVTGTEGESLFLRIQAGSGGCYVKSYGLVTDVT